MASLNKVLLIGNVGQDPEVRRTEAGTAVVNLSVATTARWTDRKDGDRKERTEWHRVVVWGRQAEVAGEFLQKGAAVFIEGSLQTREWEDRDGNTRHTTEVRAQRLQLLGRRGEEPTTQEPADS
jgi:single-strand DNA-binding protein